MNLVDDLQVRNKPCGFATLQQSFSDVETVAVNDIINQIRTDPPLQGSTRIPNISWLYRALNRNGHSIGMPVLKRHIRHECSCPS